MSPDVRIGVFIQEQSLGNSSGNLREITSSKPRPLQRILGRELDGYQRIAGNVLDSMKISAGEKLDFFNYFIWQERGVDELKKLRDIREYELVSLWDRVVDNEDQRHKYETFYSSYNTVAYFLDLKVPPSNREKAVNSFRSFCLSVAWARQDHPEWTLDEIARELGGAYRNVDTAMRVLRHAELVKNSYEIIKSLTRGKK